MEQFRSKHTTNKEVRMFKIDWPCAIGGAILGYYAKGKVEDTKSKFQGIYTGAVSTLKEAFSEDSKDTNNTQASGNGKNGKNG